MSSDQDSAPLDGDLLELDEEFMETVPARRRVKRTKGEESKGPSFMVELLRGEYSPLFYTLVIGAVSLAVIYYKTH